MSSVRQSTATPRVDCIALWCGSHTPTCLYAAAVRPEQSNESGPAVLNRYGLPSLCLGEGDDGVDLARGAVGVLGRRRPTSGRGRRPTATAPAGSWSTVAREHHALDRSIVQLQQRAQLDVVHAGDAEQVVAATSRCSCSAAAGGCRRSRRGTGRVGIGRAGGHHEMGARQCTDAVDRQPVRRQQRRSGCTQRAGDAEQVVARLHGVRGRCCAAGAARGRGGGLRGAGRHDEAIAGVHRRCRPSGRWSPAGRRTVRPACGRCRTGSRRPSRRSRRLVSLGPVEPQMPLARRSRPMVRLQASAETATADGDSLGVTNLARVRVGGHLRRRSMQVFRHARDGT